MAPATKTYFDALDTAGQDAFLAKSAEDQAAQIESITKGDPILYTCADGTAIRSEEHTSELQSLMRISYAVFCLKKNTIEKRTNRRDKTTNKTRTKTKYV